MRRTFLGTGNLVKLRELGAQTLALIRTVPGSADSALEQENDQAQVQISVSRPQIARYEINIQEVKQLLELAVGGKAITSVFEGERRFDVTARYTQAAGTDLADRGNIGPSWYRPAFRKPAVCRTGLGESGMLCCRSVLQAHAGSREGLSPLSMKS